MLSQETLLLHSCSTAEVHRASCDLLQCIQLQLHLVLLSVTCPILLVKHAFHVATKLMWCRYNEKMQRMQRGLDGTVDELFTYSCPKFVAATPPRLDNLTVNSNQEAYR